MISYTLIVLQNNCIKEISEVGVRYDAFCNSGSSIVEAECMKVVHAKYRDNECAIYLLSIFVLCGSAELILNFESSTIGLDYGWKMSSKSDRDPASLGYHLPLQKPKFPQLVKLWEGGSTKRRSVMLQLHMLQRGRGSMEVRLDNHRKKMWAFYPVLHGDIQTIYSVWF